MYIDMSLFRLGLMQPNTILAMQNIKLHIGNVRAKKIYVT